jgi:hypothetical protein
MAAWFFEITSFSSRRCDSGVTCWLRLRCFILVLSQVALQMNKKIENFSCRRCGFCCSLSGFVILEKGEVEKIAAFLGLDIYEFTERFTTLTNGRKQLTLTEQENGRCIFLEDDNSCRIQDVKPVQCTGFPYKWRSKDLEKGCEGFAAMTGEST